MTVATPTGRRGRLAPTPTGLLHVGHARTFAEAARRAGSAGLVLRIEDLDGARCREEFVAAAIEDLRWIAEHGLRGGVLISSPPPDCKYVPPLYDPALDPFWRECEALGVPVNAHGGTGLPDFGRYP